MQHGRRASAGRSRSRSPSKHKARPDVHNAQQQSSASLIFGTPVPTPSPVAPTVRRVLSRGVPRSPSPPRLPRNRGSAGWPSPPRTPQSLRAPSPERHRLEPRPDLVLFNKLPGFDSFPPRGAAVTPTQAPGGFGLYRPRKPAPAPPHTLDDAHPDPLAQSEAHDDYATSNAGTGLTAETLAPVLEDPDAAEGPHDLEHSDLPARRDRGLLRPDTAASQQRSSPPRTPLLTRWPTGRLSEGEPFPPPPWPTCTTAAALTSSAETSAACSPEASSRPRRSPTASLHDPELTRRSLTPSGSPDAAPNTGALNTGHHSGSAQHTARPQSRQADLRRPRSRQAPVGACQRKSRSACPGGDRATARRGCGASSRSRSQSPPGASPQQQQAQQHQAKRPRTSPTRRRAPASGKTRTTGGTLAPFAQEYGILKYRDLSRGSTPSPASRLSAFRSGAAAASGTPTHLDEVSRFVDDLAAGEPLSAADLGHNHSIGDIVESLSRGEGDTIELPLSYQQVVNQSVELLMEYERLLGPIKVPGLERGLLPMFAEVPIKHNCHTMLRRMAWARTLRSIHEVTEKQRLRSGLLAGTPSAVPWQSPVELGARVTFRVNPVGGFHHALLRYPIGCGFTQTMQPPAVWCEVDHTPSPHQPGGKLSRRRKPKSDQGLPAAVGSATGDQSATSSAHVLKSLQQMNDAMRQIVEPSSSLASPRSPDSANSPLSTSPERSKLSVLAEESDSHAAPLLTALPTEAAMRIEGLGAVDGLVADTGLGSLAGPAPLDHHFESGEPGKTGVVIARGHGALQAALAAEPSDVSSWCGGTSSHSAPTRGPSKKHSPRFSQAPGTDAAADPSNFGPWFTSGAPTRASSSPRDHSPGRDSDTEHEHRNAPFPQASVSGWLPDPSHAPSGSSGRDPAAFAMAPAKQVTFLEAQRSAQTLGGTSTKGSSTSPRESLPYAVIPASAPAALPNVLSSTPAFVRPELMYAAARHIGGAVSPVSESIKLRLLKLARAGTPKRFALAAAKSAESTGSRGATRIRQSRETMDRITSAAAALCERPVVIVTQQDIEQATQRGGDIDLTSWVDLSSSALMAAIEAAFQHRSPRAGKQRAATCPSPPPADPRSVPPQHPSTAPTGSHRPAVQLHTPGARTPRAEPGAAAVPGAEGDAARETRRTLSVVRAPTRQEESQVPMLQLTPISRLKAHHSPSPGPQRLEALRKDKILSFAGSMPPLAMPSEPSLLDEFSDASLSPSPSPVPPVNHRIRMTSIFGAPGHADASSRKAASLAGSALGGPDPRGSSARDLLRRDASGSMDATQLLRSGAAKRFPDESMTAHTTVPISPMVSTTAELASSTRSRRVTSPDPPEAAKVLVSALPRMRSASETTPGFLYSINELSTRTGHADAGEEGFEALNSSVIGKKVVGITSLSGPIDTGTDFRWRLQEATLSSATGHAGEMSLPGPRFAGRQESVNSGQRVAVGAMGRADPVHRPLHGQPKGSPHVLIGGEAPAPTQSAAVGVLLDDVGLRMALNLRQGTAGAGVGHVKPSGGGLLRMKRAQTSMSVSHADERIVYWK